MSGKVGSDGLYDDERAAFLEAFNNGIGSRVLDLVCHCGEPVRFGFDGDPTHHRGMCEDCDSVRCDAYPGECGR